MRRAVLIGIASALVHCAAPPPPGCSPADNARTIAAIDIDYLNALLRECLQYGPRDQCPHAERLERERDAKVQAYEKRCQR